MVLEHEIITMLLFVVIGVGAAVLGVGSAIAAAPLWALLH